MNAITTIEKSWFVKYKLYHILFWIIYHFCWWVLTIGDPVKTLKVVFMTEHGIKFASYVLWQAFAIYFNLYYLVPKYLEKGRIFEFLNYLILTILITSILICGGQYLVAYVSEQTFEEIFNVKPEKYLHFFWSDAFPSTLGNMTLAMSIKFTKNWIKAQKRQQLLEKEKLETELKFLKYQFNPHFLFNSINSIFFLIHKDPNRASNSLAKFSELLRYQLYECNEKQIPLHMEVTYLENFIALEKLRKNIDFQLKLDINHQAVGNLEIAPFILMVFVENAFKHVSTHQNQVNWIKIKLQIEEEHTLYFEIVNSKSELDELNREAVVYGGIGLKNVCRRLDLIYPSQHQLDIQNNQNYFEVKLRLELVKRQDPKYIIQKDKFTY